MNADNQDWEYLAVELKPDDDFLAIAAKHHAAGWKLALGPTPEPGRWLNYLRKKAIPPSRPSAEELNAMREYRPPKENPKPKRIQERAGVKVAGDPADNKDWTVLGWKPYLVAVCPHWR
jgi:hypothetical protein